MTSSLHLLVLQAGQAGTTLSSVYRPPREIASMQSRCSGLSVTPQYAHPPQAARSAAHCSSVRSCSTLAMRRFRRRAARALRLPVTAIPAAYAARIARTGNAGPTDATALGFQSRPRLRTYLWLMLGRTVRSVGRQAEIYEVARGGVSDTRRIAHSGVVIAVPSQQGGIAQDFGEGDSAGVRGGCVVDGPDDQQPVWRRSEWRLEDRPLRLPGLAGEQVERGVGAEEREVLRYGLRLGADLLVGWPEV